MLMLDEAEDVFSDDDSFFGAKKARQKNKAFVNRLLEESTLPTIWLTNSVHSFDEAVLRRFDMTFELPIPPKSKREQMIRSESDGLLNEESIKKLSESEQLSPAVISRSLSVVKKVKDEIENPSNAVVMMADDILRTLGKGSLGNSESNALPSSYDPSLVNTNADLQNIAEGIKHSKCGRLCLYGAPGTGKSAFGKWLADYLEKPFIIKKGVICSLCGLEAPSET